MTDKTVFFYPSLNSAKNSSAKNSGENPELKNNLPESDVQIETATCTEAETFVLRVLDDSMEPEFRRGCLIIIDPTGRATDGSYVLSRHSPASDRATHDTVQNDPEEPIDGYVFRQLKQANNGWILRPVNQQYKAETRNVTLEDIVGVIVQRAGTRRSYHKHYN